MNLLAQPRGRIALFTLLYVSEGAPIGFIWWALPTLMRAEGVAVERITSLTALLVLPWVLKVVWAPLVDAGRGPRWGFRSWIISAQLLMGLALLPLIWLDPAEHFAWWQRLLLVHAIAAATQDVAIDALAIHLVPERQRGWLNGAMQAGMLLGRSGFGGGAIFLASRLGWSWVLTGLVMVIWCSLALIGMAREPETLASSRTGVIEIGRKARGVLRRRSTWLGLGFALVAGAGFEATGALAGPYLVDRGVAPESIGAFYGLAVVLAMLTGGLIGGRLADRWGTRILVAGALLGWVAMISGLAILDWQSGEACAHRLPFGLLTGMYFFVGMFTAGSYAWFMNLTEPSLGATQFSAFMAATNGCEAWAVWAGGRLTTSFGYGLGFFALSLVSLLGLIFLRSWPQSKPTGDSSLGSGAA